MFTEQLVNFVRVNNYNFTWIVYLRLAKILMTVINFHVTWSGRFWRHYRPIARSRLFPRSLFQHFRPS